jgi:hypothetical protein
MPIPPGCTCRDQHRGKAAIFKINVVDRAVDRILVVADPKFDLNGELVYAPGRKKVVGVRYSAADERVLFWDFDAQRLQARIDQGPAGSRQCHSQQQRRRATAHRERE